jgi:hypothetical protein
MFHIITGNFNNIFTQKALDDARLSLDLTYDKIIRDYMYALDTCNESMGGYKDDLEASHRKLDALHQSISTDYIHKDVIAREYEHRDVVAKEYEERARDLYLVNSMLRQNLTGLKDAIDETRANFTAVETRLNDRLRAASDEVDALKQERADLKRQLELAREDVVDANRRLNATGSKPIAIPARPTGPAFSYGKVMRELKVKLQTREKLQTSASSMASLDELLLELDGSMKKIAAAAPKVSVIQVPAQVPCQLTYADDSTPLLDNTKQIYSDDDSDETSYDSDDCDDVSWVEY